MMTALDHTLYLALNAGAEPPHMLVLLAVALAKYLVVLVPLHIALVWFAGDRQMRFIALCAAAAIALALIINGVIGLLIYVPRPFIIGLGHTLIEHRPSSAFPSNHATIFFAYAMVLALFGRSLLAGLVGVAGLLVAWARIYLGIHFPLDMVGAAVVSAVAAWATVQGVTRYGQPGFALLDRTVRWPKQGR